MAQGWLSCGRAEALTLKPRTLAAWYEADMHHEGDTSSTKGEGFLVSLDAGYAYALAGGLTLKPQARVLWQSLFLDDFGHENSRLVFGADERIESRLGVALEGESYAATAFMVHTDGNTASLTTGMTQNYNIDGFAFELGARAALADVWGFAVSGEMIQRLSLEREDSTTPPSNSPAVSKK